MPIPIINVIVTYIQILLTLYHKHVFTGNLDIVVNQEIKTLMSKDLNFRIQKRFNIDSTYNTILSAVELYNKKVPQSL